MANRIKGITVEIGGDSTKLQDALKGVNSQIRSTESQLEDVNKLLKLDPGNTELIAQKHKLLAEAADETKKKLETLKTAQEQANEALNKGEISQEQYDALQREIVETEQKLKDKDKVIQTAEQFILDRRDTAALERERDELREQISEIVTAISGNSTVVLDRFQYKAENEELYRQHGEINTRYEAVLEELKQAKSDIAAGEEFLRYFTEMTGPIKKFNELYWDKLLDKMIVDEGKELTAVFIGGYRVKI